MANLWVKVPVSFNQMLKSKGGFFFYLADQKNHFNMTMFSIFYLLDQFKEKTAVKDGTLHFLCAALSLCSNLNCECTIHDVQRRSLFNDKKTTKIK